MNDSPAGADNDSQQESQEVERSVAQEDAELEVSAATTLVEFSRDIAVVFGEVPEKMELLKLDSLPGFDRQQLSTLLGSISNISAAAGSVAEGVSGVQGFYRISDASLSLLNSGGALAVKDGANLGAILNNGKIVGQARFIPVAMSAKDAVASVAPTIAMIGLQLQISELASLTRTNIALTTQTLKIIRNEQWSELEALVESVSEAVDHTRGLESIPESSWDSIAASGPSLRKQLKLYRKNVADYSQELGKLDGRPLRQYLESNAEAMSFDVYALLHSLKAYAEYQMLKSLRARSLSAEDEKEAQLFERIGLTMPDEIQSDLEKIKRITKDLVRELRIIAELPGRATLSLTNNRRGNKAVKLTCQQLLDAIEPVANSFHYPVPMSGVSDGACVPEGLGLDPYLNILRWFMEDEEVLRTVAFPYSKRSSAFLPMLNKRVDGSWKALSPGIMGTASEKLAAGKFVAVTNQRIITADPREFLREGLYQSELLLDDIKFVRPPSDQEKNARPTITITTERRDINWMFPEVADEAQVDRLAELICSGESSIEEKQREIEGIDTQEAGETDSAEEPASV
ncbi:hypothetical protein [Corynebacterium alimapuense]|uniref:Uncharacterized protein n=1 Tax=Corynebacterium alimapuense TaxID=1576874 RepID=A0A3M8K9W5_9CORY|nr:hypothetical protein [Corynebacterium alimapuense]RNE49936.1 hypothetical protein C5L39_00745 [Corynebacterium alimapuense]